jgi:multicomponent Na+:H+ antiporter subunit B
VIEIIDIVLFALLAITAIAMLRLHDLFAIVMLSGIYSLISAAMFTNMDAVDVAFTEAAVGAGISTVLMLGTLALTSSKEKVTKTPSRLPLLLVILTGAALIYGTVDMPDFGDVTSPVNSRVTDRYISESGEAMGIPNIVTSVLASYRGYDTMGETTVIFTAAIAVLLLLGRTVDGVSRGSRDGGIPADGAPRPRPKTTNRAPSSKAREDEE